MARTKRTAASFAYRTVGAIIAIAAAVFGGPRVLQMVEGNSHDAEQSPAQTAVAPAAPGAAADEDYFRIDGPAHVDYQAKNGRVDYCPLDRLQRPVCAYGNLTSTMRADAKKRGRQPISVDPVGWGHNAEADIPALSQVPGSDSYHGWFWNRSHLLADSLGGDAVSENLVTGTRTQNVGSAQKHGEYAGGMAHTEHIAREYLESGAGDSCPLYYAAAPVYTGDELIPRTVTVDIRSCDSKIDQHVIVDNTAAGFNVDYTTGQFTPVG